MEQPPFEPQLSPNHVWVVAYDTVMGGWDCVQIKEGGEYRIALVTEEEGLQECQKWMTIMEGVGDANNPTNEYFLVHKDDYIHHRRILPFDLMLGMRRIIRPPEKEDK